MEATAKREAPELPVPAVAPLLDPTDPKQGKGEEALPIPAPPPQAKRGTLKPPKNAVIPEFEEVPDGKGGKLKRAIDPARYMRENGIPAPRFLYRVSAGLLGEFAEPVEVIATDPTDAIRQAVNLYKLKEQHRYSFQTFKVAE